MKKLTPFFALPLSALILIACSSGGSTSTSSNDSTITTVTIPFQASANDIQIDCDADLTGLGIAGTDATVKDFRFYIHDIELTTDASRTLALTLDTNPWQSNGVALLDFQNKSDSCEGDAKETHTSVTGSVNLNEGESVNGVNFTVGLPTVLNHQNLTEADSPMNIPSLSWGWQVGHKYMRLDIAPVGGITRPTDGTYNSTNWFLHLGSTDCSGDPALDEEVNCDRINRPKISLDNFTLGEDTIVMDYGVLIANNNLGQDEAGPSGCMSGSTDPECQGIFTALGLDLISGDQDNANNQTVFRLN
ncbi:MbnP family copper-binding protein [Hahella ganghwensis]|uniref:MbnP family copper-binding protein n=1 Tax=Hahella ganghwensis TaxID=286420 RepID=UPI0003680770|nr:MbnP family copper-binding protein [Hahella ganghwensis]